MADEEDPGEEAIAIDFGQIAERETFLRAISLGTPPMLAGIEVGWRPLQTKKELKDPEFAALVLEAKSLSLDSLERKLHKMGLAGNMSALQMMLYNKRPDDWRDVKRIEVKTETTVTFVEVAAAKQALIEILRTNGAAALAPGGALDAPIQEAVIVDDD